MAHLQPTLSNTYQLTIEPLGETINVERDQSILDAALRAGVYLPYACNHGLCGTCKVEVVEGEVEHNHASPFALLDLEKEEGLALACCGTLASDVIIEAEVESDPDARSLPIRDYVGEVSRIEQLTRTIKGVWISLNGPGIYFQAGQYINLSIPGLEHPRAFSIASGPSERLEIELNVQEIDGGAGTAYLHNKLKVGEELTFTAPLGRFFVRKSAPNPIVFLAGGAGLSAPKAMIIDLLGGPDERDITLIHGVRTKQELFHAELFGELEKRHKNFHYLVAYSDPEDSSNWQVPRRMVHELAEDHFSGRFSGLDAYLCGPPAMVDACITSLIKGRLFEKNIFMESFYTGADALKPKRRSALFKKF